MFWSTYCQLVVETHNEFSFCFASKWKTFQYKKKLYFDFDLQLILFWSQSIVIRKQFLANKKASKWSADKSKAEVKKKVSKDTKNQLKGSVILWVKSE